MDETKKLKVYFDFAKVFTKTKEFVDYHNSKNPELKQKLNANHRATAELITRLYIKQLNKAIQLGDDLSKDIPPFTSYNSSLATCKGCTIRTIINHKERLKASGFIIGEEHRGKTGIALWINPAIFSIPETSGNSVKSEASANQKDLLFELKVKKFHPLVHEQQEQINNNSAVNTKITHKKEDRLSAHQLDNNSVTGTSQELDMNTVESRNSNPKKQTGRVKNLHVQELEPAFLLGLVKDFWQYAKGTLYHNLLLSDPEEKEILNHIWASVYRKFKVQGTHQDWKNYQDILYKRIDMVHRWLQRNPNRWVPPPHLYFNIENKRNGFNKTYQWFIKQELLKKEIQNQILIQKTDQEWKDHKNGKGKYKHKTRLQLFHIHQKRLTSYNDKDLLRVYHQCLHQNLTL